MIFFRFFFAYVLLGWVKGNTNAPILSGVILPFVLWLVAPHPFLNLSTVNLDRQRILSFPHRIILAIITFSHDILLVYQWRSPSQPWRRWVLFLHSRIKLRAEITFPPASINTLAHRALLNERDHSFVSSLTREQGAFPVVYFRFAGIGDSLVDLRLVIACMRWITCKRSTGMWHIIWKSRTDLKKSWTTVVQSRGAIISQRTTSEGKHAHQDRKGFHVWE